MDELIKTHLKTLNEKVDRLLGAVLGNGHEGLMLRVDRLEQRAALLNKLLWSVGGAAVIALVTALITAFVK